MPTLEEHIITKVPAFDKSTLLEYGSGAFFEELLFLITNLELQSTKKNKTIPALLISKATFCYHSDCIDLLVEFIIDKKIDNVLKLGFTDGSTFNSSKPYVFKGYNSTIELLKSKPMEIVRSIIGVEEFLYLILHFNGIWAPSNQLLWGEFQQKSYERFKRPHSISFRSMLYVHTSVLHKTNPVAFEPWKLLTLIFKDAKLDCRKKNEPPRRLRKAFKLIKMLIINHNSHMKEYPYIVDQICDNNKSDDKDNLSLSTDKSRVIKFIMTIIYKVIPLDFFGTEKNRSLVIRSIPRLINNTIISKVSMEEVICNVQLNQISWIKPRANFTLTKPEFITAKKLFCSFISWLFQVFICKVTAAFFYVTQASQKNRPLFFRHHIWNRMTKKYLSKYVTNHLINLKDTQNSFSNYSENKDFIGNLSLQPKKSGFRLIVKPFKGSWDKKIEYLTYQKRILRPVMQILQKVRTHNSCSSVTEIINRIYTYKSQLLASNDGKIPIIYCYKFDAQNAYDSVPHEIVLRVLSERLDTFTNSDIIYLQSFNEIDKSGLLRRRRNIVVDCLSDLSILRNSQRKYDPHFTSNKRLIDSHETFKFTKSEILSLAARQCKNTCFHTESRSYYRKIGFYQGFPMSALLFNIVYDALVADFYAELGNHEETTIVRLMDDFLVLSTKKHHIDLLKKLTSRCMKTYNLNINRLKTEFSTSEVSFAGLNIDIKRLVCHKLLEDYNNAPIQAFTFQKLYKSLMRFIQLRTKTVSLFDPSIDKSERTGCRRNVISLLKSILFKFCNSYRLLRFKSDFKITVFSQFLTNVFSFLTTKLPLIDIGVTFDRFWLYTLRILRYKRIIQ